MNSHEEKAFYSIARKSGLDFMLTGSNKANFFLMLRISPPTRNDSEVEGVTWVINSEMVAEVLKRCMQWFAVVSDGVQFQRVGLRIAGPWIYHMPQTKIRSY